MTLADLQQLESRYVMPTYAKSPVEFVRGEGARLWDAEGREYLDFFAGLSVHNAGHCHPKIVDAITEQTARLAGVSNLYYTAPAMRLAERLAESSLGGKVFLCNSGLEANECALKLARKRAHRRGHRRARGRGARPARSTAARSPRWPPRRAWRARTSSARCPPASRRCRRDDPDALRAAVGEGTAAVLLEPIQGEAGVFPIADEVLVAAREACDEAGALLVFDEIQTGMGRTGSLWAYEQLPVSPDVMTAAKALGGGLPVGACVTDPGAGDVLRGGRPRLHLRRRADRRRRRRWPRSTVIDDRGAAAANPRAWRQVHGRPGRDRSPSPRSADAA